MSTRVQRFTYPPPAWEIRHNRDGSLYWVRPDWWYRSKCYRDTETGEYVIVEKLP